ncbi:hypothetical protein AYR54_07495 [Loigolactobacillus backii]|uniref:Uncharacterized protein n=1 Tax=Loigolactobacillus backii TaxID=375175 RepID=A0A192H0N2_9LACO|nr:hypothetical protein [Loigolactobacillus backii]ANK60203.1 hypothetical protein AYR52_08085 [Loigolactobacillus backii]ANK62354.1 hypothetical protein AYR53_05900 [Loigolactobacillus backii]ANK65085.1 hypothetical protein AYR54_07495 [Loigolactobacillus backii]ANK67644.1 hypothetical protein AYR55_08100 [Loigolactobacillus backii]ANK70634.1 hypothetical protein AYR56_11090 [Loigolactobacillus backii]
MKLFKLELEKVDLKNYLRIALFIPLIVLIFVYFFASVPYFDATTATTDPELLSYNFILLMGFLLNTAAFTFLGATMMGKIVMNAYSEKNVYLTLSYPVSRRKLLFVKLKLVNLFCGVLSMLSFALVISIFLGIEAVIPIVQDQLTLTTYLGQLPFILLSALIVPAISLCSLWIGWKKNSLALLIFSAIILFSLMSNTASLGSGITFYAFTFIYLFLAVIVTLSLISKVDKMEV